MSRAFRVFICRTGGVVHSAVVALTVTLLAGHEDRAHAACNLIPQTVKVYDSVRGSTNRPYAAPNEPLELRVRPCDPGGPGFTAPAANYVVTVVFTPAGGTKNVVVLATSCAGVGSCAGAASTTCIPVSVGSGLGLVTRDGEPHLQFTFPDTDALLAPGGDALSFSGPATIAVKDSSVAPGGQAAACELVTQKCAASSGSVGLVACIDDFFANDGACGTALAQGTFNHFTALPPANDYQAACFDEIGPCNPGSNPPLRLTTDAEGNVLIPMDWRGILVQQNQIPVPRLMRTTIDVPALPLKIPGKSFVASYTPEGGLLPPIFEPQFVAQAVSGALTLFGSADAPYTVLRLARRSETFQECTGGANDAGPCNEAEDCPGACSNDASQSCTVDADCGSGNTCGVPGTCGPTVCSNNAAVACNHDAQCAGGGCGPQLFDVRLLGFGGTGPVTIARLASAGICQQSVLPPATGNMCTVAMPCSGDGPCVQYALTAESPVPLEGLAQTNDVFAFAINEGVDSVPRNNDGDTVDTVVTLRDRATGQTQPLGAPPPICNIPASPPPQGRAIVRTQQPPFSFPALATENDIVAFLESEATTNDPTPPGLACDMNGDGDTADAILRVYKLGSGEVTPSVANPVADGALRVNGRALAVSNGRVFFRSSEQEDAAQHTTRISLDPMGMQLNNASGAAFTPNLPTVSYDGRYVIFDAFDPNVVTIPVGAGHHLVVRDIKMGTNELVNVGNGDQLISPSCFDQSISADGRWAVFACATANFEATPIPSCTSVLYGTGPCEQVFLRDRCMSNGNMVPSCTKHTELITVDSMGNPGTDHTEGSSVSADGRYVAFVTWAPNVIGTPTTCASKLYASGTCPEIVVHDRCFSNGTLVTGCTPNNTIVSVATDGTRTNQRSEYPVISANGRVVAFQSRADNLDPADPSTIDSIYVRDLDSNKTEFVSVDSFGVTSNNFAFVPSISADGRFVSFESLGSNLVPGDNNGLWDTFVHDRLTGATERVTLNSNGEEQAGPCPGNGSDGGQLSADGRFVLFQTACGNLVPGVNDGIYHVYVRDRATGTTKIADISDAGDAGDQRISGVPASISGDGRFAVFPSTATNLVAGDTNNVCDNNNDYVFDENCNDVFMRGLDLNSSSGDITGDGDANDTVLRSMDGSSGSVATLCPADQVSVVAGAAAFLRPEAAGETPSLGVCPAGTAVGGGISLNGDSDADDEVVHFAPNSTTVENLERAATAVSLGAQCTTGTSAGQECSGGDPSCNCTATWVGALISEAGQGNADLNGDTDTRDDVVEVHRTSDLPGVWTNVGQAADTLEVAGGLAVFITPEASQGAKLDGDGDKSDRVLQVYDANSGNLTNTHQPAEEFVVGSERVACAGGPLIAFRTHEADLCDVPIDTSDNATCTVTPLPAGCSLSTCDLDGDGDCCNDVLQVYAKGLGVINTHQGVIPCGLEACDPRLPYRVFGSKVKFLTVEKYMGSDLNADGDRSDVVLQQFDVCTKTVTVLATVDTSASTAAGSSGASVDPLAEPPAQGAVVVVDSGRCVAGSEILLVPPVCASNADCPSGATCESRPVVAAPEAAPQHDSVVAPRAALQITIPKDQTVVTKQLRVAVRNADILPSKESPGHVIRLVVTDGTCPPGTVAGLADFDGRTPGAQDNVLLAGGMAKIGRVPLSISRASFATFNHLAPARCNLQVTASALVVGNVDPTPANNVLPVELNVIDRNDAEITTTHESVLSSVRPVKLNIAKRSPTMSAHKTVSVKLVNADLGESPGDGLTLSASQGNCPAGTVTVDAPATQTVAGGAVGSRAKLTVNVTGAGFSAKNAKSPARCTAVLTVAGSSNPDTDPSNNSTNLVIDVNDRADY